MNKQALIILIFCFLATQARAQQPAMAKESSKLFVAVQACQSHYVVFFPVSPNNTGVGAWQIAIGGNVSRRLGIQAGYTYRHDLHIDNPSYTGTNTLGQQVSGSSYDERRTNCIPLLFKYAAVKFARPRLQVDMIAGVTFLQTAYTIKMEDRVNNQVVESVYDQDAVRHVYATFGAGLRYPFGRHFEGVFDWTYSKNLRNASDAVNLGITGNKFGMTRALGLGLRYSFTLKKKEVVTSGS